MRINSHMSNANLYTNELYENIHKIEYCELESDYHMNIYEIHYICKYKPKFNIEFASDNTNLFDLPDIKWNTYVLKKYTQEFCNMNIVREGAMPEDTMKKLKDNNDFYNEYTEGYLETSYINRQFNNYRQS